jgi:sphinganine-1-phosphate aldolase
VEEELTKEFEKERDPTKSRKLPKEGMRADNIESRVTRWFETEEKKMFTGKISGGVYVDSLEHCKEVNNFAAKYMYHNRLHLDTYKEVSKMEAEVLKMTSSLISKNRAYGLITSGGSESLIMSLYAYKCFYKNRTKPNMY